MLLEDVIKEFIFECQIRKLSKRTTKTYKNNILLFNVFVLKEFKIKELGELNQTHIKKYLQYLIEKGLSEAYANSILKCLRAFFKYCYFVVGYKFS